MEQDKNLDLKIELKKKEIFLQEAVKACLEYEKHIKNLERALNEKDEYIQELKQNNKI